MLPAAITRKTIEAWGGVSVYEQASNLVKKGSVLRADIAGDIISGEIRRPAGNDLYCRVRLLDKGRIENLCPCLTNRQQGLVCHHAVALGIALLLRRADPMREQLYREERRRALRIAQTTAGDFIQRSSRGQPAELVLQLPPEWINDFHADRIRLKLGFILNEDPVAPEKLPPSLSLALSPGHDNLLEVIEDICAGRPTELLEMSAHDFLNLLGITPRDALKLADGRTMLIHAGSRQAWLQVDLDHENGELVLYPCAEIDPPEALQGRLPVFLVSRNQGWVHINGNLWQLKNILPPPYHDIYKRDQIIPRQGVVNFLARELPMLQNIATVRMEVPAYAFETTPGHPLIKMRLKGSRASLRAEIFADYHGYEVAAGVPDAQSEFATPDPEDVLRYQVRNLEEERRAVSMLTKYGFTPSPPGLVLTHTRRVLNFLGSGYPALRRLGWHIQPSGELASWLDKTTRMVPVVTITPHSHGWFDVGLAFENPDGSVVPPSDVQRTLNRNDSFIDDGSGVAFIDSEAVDSMRAVFRDCRSRESRTPGHFMLPEIYAPFVQASLHAIDGVDIEDTPDWREKATATNRRGDAHIAPVPLGNLESILRPYQKEGVYWLRFLENAGLNGLLADEMGLGKTLQALAWLALERVNKRASEMPSLIICPTSLVGNWQREAQTFVPHLRTLVISGPERRALFEKINEQDIVITSYALLRRDIESYQPYRFSVAVLDEAQHIKNRSTRNALAAKRIAAENRLVLTGTPVENSVADIWSIMDFLMPEYLGEYASFRNSYELPITEGTSESSVAQSHLRHKLHPFILRRLKRDVARDLPEKIVKVSYCQLSEDQSKVYNHLLNQSRQRVKGMIAEKGFERSRFEILALLMRLRQACCHLDLLKKHLPPGNYANPSAKMEAFLELLDEAMDGGHRILVFSQFVAMLSLLRRELERHQLPYCYLDGTTRDRLTECERFNQNRDIPLFLISLKAGGTGLNLTGADMVVHFDPWWNPAVEDQATDRAHRIGQKRTVYGIKLITEHTIEEKVLAMQQRKQMVIDATVGATDAAVMRQLKQSDIQELLGI